LIPGFWARTHKKCLQALSFEQRRACSAQACRAAGLNRCFEQSPVDALIGIKFGSWLRRQIPVWLDLCLLTHRRITVVPQRPACNG
jgi:hypothetical protein